MTEIIDGRGTQTLVMPWHTWKPRPAAGDLCVVVSTIPFQNYQGWTQGTARVAYMTYCPGDPEPVFTAECPDDGYWAVQGYIASPP